MPTGSEALVVLPRMSTVTLSDVVLLGTFTEFRLRSGLLTFG